jgi:hypothetical protein
MQCPHCCHPITMKEVIWLMNGSGYRQLVSVRLNDGTESLCEAGLVNPPKVTILEWSNSRSLQKFPHAPNVIGNPAHWAKRDAEHLTS